MVFLNRESRSGGLLALGVVAAIVAVAQCKPQLGGRVSQIAGPRLLAVRSTPPEGSQGDSITYDALEVDPTGEIQAPIDFAYCSVRKPLDELDTVAQGCLVPSGDGISEIGGGTSASSTMPSDACRNFGPDVPSAQPGQPQGRPVDPDSTGGYYQPLRLLFESEIDVASTRIECGLAGGSLTDSAKFRAQYHANKNPVVLDVASDKGGSLSQDPNAPTPLPISSVVTLTASWPACPLSDVCGDGICGADESQTTCPADCTTPVGCGGAERYINYDTVARDIVVSRETMVVAWFVTSLDASFDFDSVGRDGADLTTDASGVLTLPATPGPLHGWAVLSDDRGGVGWRRFEILVQ